jgi:hypothetical protein
MCSGVAKTMHPLLLMLLLLMLLLLLLSRLRT